MSLRELAALHYDERDPLAKSAHYLDIYERLLADRRDLPFAILELGVGEGASLLMLRDYLPNATIVGLDVIQRPPRLDGEARIAFVEGGQTDIAALERAAECTGGRGFDLIIDDAAHIGAVAKASFGWLFPRHLNSGGFYVIEDLGAPMLPDWADGAPYSVPPDEERVLPSYHYGLMGLVKQLIDQMQRVWMGDPLPYTIAGIELAPNIAVIRKGR